MLSSAAYIRSLITQLASCKILWLDTEVADWQTSHPRLSLIQLLAYPHDLTGKSTYILDVLDKHDVVKYFVDNIMANGQIEKVFHNASYDLRFLDKERAQNVTCTLKMAKKIGRDRLGVSNLKLKTLAAELCQISNIDREEQQSDWGRRPLRAKQLQYAKMDPVYLAQVHGHLVKLIKQDNPGATVKTVQTSFSVTNVRVAIECPRLFYLTQRFGGKTMFVPSDAAGIGTIFHQLCEQFVALAKQRSEFSTLLASADANVEEVASQMQQLFYQLAFYAYMETATEMASELPQIWQGLTALIGRWAQLLVSNRRYCNFTEAIDKTFIATEQRLTHTFILPDRTQQQVVGDFDGLIYDFERDRLCVVDYKTYAPMDPSAQLIQVALYSYTIWQQQQVPVDAAVYCVLPEFKVHEYSWEQLAETVHQLIPHKLQQMREWLNWEPPQADPPPPTTQSHLCEICPQQEKCQTFFGRVGTAHHPQESTTLFGRVGTAHHPGESTTNHQESRTQQGSAKALTTNSNAQQGSAKALTTNVGEQLVKILQSFNIGVDYLGAAVGPAFIRVKLKPHLGVKVISLLNRSEDLQVQLGIASRPLIAPKAGYVSVDLPRPDREVAKFSDYIQPGETPKSLRIAIGVNLDGQLTEADLGDPNTCHFLVGGTTGSGKSEFLRSLLLSLLVRHSPERLKIALVDPKRVTFPEFERMPWLYAPVVKDPDRAIELMAELVAEMESRYQLFESASCADINAYNLKSVKQLPRIVCIFDEYADFMAEKESRTELEQSIKRLGAMARAAGIHLIVATQRPEAKVVTPIVRSNLPGRVALRTASEADSVIILGGKQTAAAYLLGKGDLLYQVGSQLERLQSLLTEKIDVAHFWDDSSQFFNFANG
ncbi:MAG: DNA translocase FtsK [Hormoscilla sp.]